MHSNTTSTTELHRQSAAYADIRKRLLNPPASRKQFEKLEQRIAELEALLEEKDEEILSLSSKMLFAEQEAGAVLTKERAQHEKLRLDHSDLQGAYIEQAKRLADIEDSICRNSEYPVSPKRTVSDIVAEVLAGYPGVTWDEIRSHRRMARLAEPRKACMRAVYEQRPDLSSPAIGRIFARDHTSVLYAVGRTTKGAA